VHVRGQGLKVRQKPVLTLGRIEVDESDVALGKLIGVV
jgi:hypothetical protein